MQIVLINLQSGFYYSLNKTGTLVFRLIKNAARYPILSEACLTRMSCAEDVVWTSINT